MKQVKRLLLGTLFLSVFALVSCSKDKNDDPDPGGDGRGKKIKYKVTVTDGVIGTVIYGFDDKTTTLTSVSGNSWESNELDIPSGVIRGSVAGNGIGNNTSSKLTTEIFVDGKKVVENTGTGKALMAYSGYDF
ncbi:hypothetical protein [Pseudobacter ginsenosidimutans]|uniref:MmpS family membrane protein n=1 Tax=Pseudobacter ginsenosidimutans TaxID=661488 RepID=A0A4Q7MR37_9BACT|nr:hypothetical protein [Pseudobacter ginsenosidimutans]QEC42286.1 hypothetical protein FSB84_11510 [Pseudobacter ginsenosidimutans]RZS70868.1 hypothetical protein EV199_2765 [Pseudobacter ginsenosidimutans]